MLAAVGLTIAAMAGNSYYNVAIPMKRNVER